MATRASRGRGGALGEQRERDPGAAAQHEHVVEAARQLALEVGRPGGAGARGEQAPGRQHARELREPREGASAGAVGVEAGHEVEARVGVGQLAGLGARELDAGGHAAANRLDHGLLGIDPGDARGPGRGEDHAPLPGPAAGVEHALLARQRGDEAIGRGAPGGVELAEHAVARRALERGGLGVHGITVVAMAEIAFVLAPGQNAFFRELAEALRAELERLGVGATIAEGDFPKPRKGLVYVLLPPHEYAELRQGDLPAELLGRTIFVCAEQPGTPWFGSNLGLTRLGGAIFDVNPASVRRMRELGIEAEHLPLGYTRLWDRFDAARRARRWTSSSSAARRARRERLLASWAPALWRRNSRLVISDNLSPNPATSESFVAGEEKRAPARRLEAAAQRPRRRGALLRVAARARGDPLRRRRRQRVVDRLRAARRRRALPQRQAGEPARDRRGPARRRAAPPRDARRGVRADPRATADERRRRAPRRGGRAPRPQAARGARCEARSACGRRAGPSRRSGRCCARSSTACRSRRTRASRRSRSPASR